MRRLLPLLLLLSLGTADAKEISGGDFAKPRPLQHGKAVVPAGMSVTGDTEAITRFVAPSPHGAAIAIAEGGSLVAVLTVPAPRETEKIDPGGWYAVASLDVLGRVSGDTSRARLRAEVRHAAGGSRLAERYMDVGTVAAHDDGGTTTARGWTQRLWIRISSDRMKDLAGETLEVEFRVESDAAVVVDNLRFDMFHNEPGRALVGKPNGKNGPDLLASGMLGFVGLTEHGHTAFSLLEIRPDGPAKRAGLQRSDLVIGVDDALLGPGSLAAGEAWFTGGHEAALGRAIERALSEGRRKLELRVLRDGSITSLRVDIPVPKRMKPAEVDELMRADVLSWVAPNQKKNGFWPGNEAVNSCLAGLALLATHDPSHASRLEKLVDRLLEKNPRARDTTGFSYWSIAYQGIFFCEYYLASGDKRVLAWIEDAIEWLPSTTHECRWGMQAFGHSPKGLPYSDKALMAPCSHLLVFEALAERCGLTSGVWDHIEPYVMHSWSDPDEGGHGGMGYNAAAKDKSQFWSRTGLVALALHLRGHHERMKDALTAIMVERHAWMLNSHAYGEPGGALGLIALSVVDPDGFEQVARQWRWRFLNAWEPGYGLRYSSAHMGAPYMGEEEIMNPAYALLFGVQAKGLVLAGGEPARWLRR